MAALAVMSQPGGDATRVAEQPDKGRPCLVVEHLSATSARGPLHDVSLEVRRGERVGVAGLLGAGVATLARAVAGAQPWQSGKVEIDGVPLVPGRPDKALKAGVGFVPEDRRAEGFVRLLGVAENSTMTIVDRLANWLGVVTPRAKAAAARPLAQRLSIVSAGLGQPVGELSGGNQQKVTVARALATAPKVVVAIAPTAGSRRGLQGGSARGAVLPGQPGRDGRPPGHR